MRERLNKELRRAQIIKRAESMAKRKGFYSKGFNVIEIAKQLGVTKTLIYQHFNSMAALREAVLIKSFEGDKVVFNMALVSKDPVARKLNNDSSRAEKL